MPVKRQDELDPSGHLCLGLGLPRGRQRPKVLLGTPQHCQGFLAHPSTLDHVWAGFVPRCGGDTGAGARGTTSPTRQGLSLSPLPRLCLCPQAPSLGLGTVGTRVVLEHLREVGACSALPVQACKGWAGGALSWSMCRAGWWCPGVQR